MGGCLSTASAPPPPPAPLAPTRSEDLRLERLAVQLDRVEKHNRRLRGHIETAQEHGCLPRPPPPDAPAT